MVCACMCVCVSAARAVLLWPAGCWYVGQVSSTDRRDRPHGSGRKHHADGSVEYTGEWRNGNCHGSGVWTCPEDDSYEGEFRDDEIHGLGSYTWEDGGTYSGEWEEGDKCGFGMEWDEDSKLSACGRWADDELVESCPVPRALVPLAKFLSAAGRTLPAHTHS